MKKRLTAILCMLLTLTLLLPACGGGKTPDTPTEAPTDAPTEPVTDPETTPAAPDTDPVTTPDTEPATDPVTPPETEPEETVPADVEDIELSFGPSPILYLTVGETADVESNVGTDKYAVLTETVHYASGEKVFTYENGKVTAVGGGCARLDAVNPYTGRSASLTVRVVDPAHDETCIIAAPIWDYTFMDERQMKYLADANFNAIFMSHAPDKNIIQFFGWAEPYGIQVFPMLATPSASELDMPKKTIQKRINSFSSYAAFSGFNLRDEPSRDFAEYADIADYVYSCRNDLEAMVNFLPDVSRETLFNYASALHDHDYKSVLSFDNYIFGPAPGSVSETWLFRNFELFREAGLANRCRTAFYIQSIGSGTYGYRRPDEGTMFYHGMVSLAYGCTMMRYFSYTTPNLTDYTTGVIDFEGNPTDLYPVSAALNKKYAAYGYWLIHANADEVYHTGAKLDAGADYEILPDDYYVQPADADEAAKRAILTTFTDRFTGQNYLMIVNKDFENAVTLRFRLDGVDTLYEVDGDTGLVTEAAYADGILTVELSRGNARLYLLPFGKTYTAAKESSVNLLADAYVSPSTAAHNAGYSTEYLTDGKNLSEAGCIGWRAYEETDGAWIYADLNGEKTFNRLDVYPAGSGASCGRFFPQTIELQISADGVEWTTVAALTKPDTMEAGLTVTFDAVNARLIRLNIPTLYHISKTYMCELAEICLFNDPGDGSIPAPEKTDYVPLEVQPGVNVALGKALFDCSSTQNTWEWHEHQDCLTDGQTCEDTTYHFSSAVAAHADATAHEYFVLDLNAAYPVDRIVLWPAVDGAGFPRSFTVQVSENGSKWTTVYTAKRADPNTGTPLEITFETMSVSFVKVDATMLSLHGNPNAGYVLEFSELEVYTPD